MKVYNEREHADQGKIHSPIAIDSSSSKHPPPAHGYILWTGNQNESFLPEVVSVQCLVPEMMVVAAFLLLW